MDEQEQVIHEIEFTAECEFDYEQCLVGGIFDESFLRGDTDWNERDVHDAPFYAFDGREIKRDLDEFLNGHSKRDKNDYFRVRHWDDNLDRWLLLFIKRGEKNGDLQKWRVLGICNEWDWDEDAEYGGDIRNWYRSKIVDLSEDTDWAEAINEREELEFMEEDLDEIKDEIWELGRELKFERSVKGAIAGLLARHQQAMERRKELEFNIVTKRERIRRLEGEDRFD